ncbi:MAG: hypothetical protein RL223_3271, partial [Pseudomonadota bacterium]
MSRAAIAPQSIGARLSSALLWISVAWGLLAALAVWLVVEHEVDELLDDALITSAGLISGLLPDAATQDVVLSQAASAVSLAPSSKRFSWQVVDRNARVLIRSARAPGEALLARHRQGLSDSPSGWRVYGLLLGHEGRMLYVAQSRGERLEALADVTLGTLLAALLVGGGGATALRRRARRELLPLNELCTQVQRHDPMDPATALPRAERLELQPIRDAIDGLGRRLAQRIRQERAVVAHAAHALRTPLAGMDVQLAVALRECPPEATGTLQRLRRTREATSRLSRVVSALLTLFRTGVDLERRPVDAAELLASLPAPGLQLDFAPAFDLDATLDDALPPRLHADADLLAAALANLLDNAVRHGARQVSVEPVDGGLRLTDDGPGIDPVRLQALQQALDTQAYEGRTGLGLMLADLVARAHGGRLRLGPSPHGSGLAVTLTLSEPADPPPRQAGPLSRRRSDAAPGECRRACSAPNRRRARSSAPPAAAAARCARCAGAAPGSAPRPPA